MPEDDYYDPARALGEGVLRQRVISREEAEAMYPSITEEYRGQRFTFTDPMDSSKWAALMNTTLPTLTATQVLELQRRDDMRKAVRDEIERTCGVPMSMLEAIAAAEGVQATREKVRGTVTLPCEQMRYGWHKPTPEQFEAPLRLGTFGRLEGFTIHKAVPLVGQIDLGNDIKRQRAAQKRQSQAELAKIRKRKGGY